MYAIFIERSINVVEKQHHLGRSAKHQPWKYCIFLFMCVFVIFCENIPSFFFSLFTICILCCILLYCIKRCAARYANYIIARMSVFVPASRLMQCPLYRFQSIAAKPRGLWITLWKNLVLSAYAKHLIVFDQFFFLLPQPF